MGDYTIRHKRYHHTDPAQNTTWTIYMSLDMALERIDPDTRPRFLEGDAVDICHDDTTHTVTWCPELDQLHPLHHDRMHTLAAQDGQDRYILRGRYHHGDPTHAACVVTYVLTRNELIRGYATPAELDQLLNGHELHHQGLPRLDLPRPRHHRHHQHPAHTDLNWGEGRWPHPTISARRHTLTTWDEVP